VAVLPLGVEGEAAEVAESIWSALAEAGVEAVLDDRDERPGVKFNDADLIGWPYQIVVGNKGLAEGVVEVKVRATGERTKVAVGDAAASVKAMVAAERERFAHR
jgi:prolyl-tRNA synthetase